MPHSKNSASGTQGDQDVEKSDVLSDQSQKRAAHSEKRVNFLTCSGWIASAVRSRRHMPSKRKPGYCGQDR